VSTEIKKHVLTLAFFAGVIMFFMYWFRPGPVQPSEPTVKNNYDSARVVNLTVNLNTSGTKIVFPEDQKQVQQLDSATLAKLITEIMQGAEVRDSTTVRDTSIEATIKTIIERNRLKSATLSYRWLKPISTVITLPPPAEKFKLFAGAFSVVPDIGPVLFGPVITCEFPKQNLSAAIGRDLNGSAWMFQIQKKIKIK